jgi:hypothetical protein
VRYFFIADRVKSKEIRIEYCPTGLMIAAYFTKSLQGVLFQQLRDMIMGNVDIALPTGVAGGTADSTDGIPVVSTPQGSRSVLDKENETSSSLFSLTVLPAYGSPVPVISQ